MNNSIKTVFKAVASTVCIILFIAQAESAASGARQALEVCAATIIPSMLPFMVISTYMLKSDILPALGKRSERICRRVFGLPGQAAVIFLMSMVGGFPVGAKLTADCVKCGQLTHNQGKRMLLFCVNPGPAFVINIVGSFMLGNQKAGVILLVSLCLASFFTGVISKIFNDKEEYVSNTEKKSSASPLVDSVSESISAIISICGWIVVFSAFLYIINESSLPEKVIQWLNMLAEVTGGCRISASNFPLPLTAFVLGWSGLSVHAQIMTYLISVGLKYKYFAVARVFNASLSMGISYLLFKLFPCQISVFSNVGEIMPKTVSVSVPATVGMLFLSALVILDLAPKRKM